MVREFSANTDFNVFKSCEPAVAVAAVQAAQQLMEHALSGLVVVLPVSSTATSRSWAGVAAENQARRPCHRCSGIARVTSC